MTDLLDQHESFESVEALVRAAGSYVRPSDDLRPRVLETARSVCGERRAQLRIGRVARWIVILAIFADAVGNQLQGHFAGSDHNHLSLDAEQVFSLAEARVVQGGMDIGWGLVDVFSDLRDRQAETLRPSL